MLDAPLGIEPRLAGSKPGLLPLEEGAILVLAYGIEPQVSDVSTETRSKLDLRVHPRRGIGATIIGGASKLVRRGVHQPKDNPHASARA